jgi:phosphatidylinositol kinase/protein kinase (PI-3  family)
LNWKERLVLIVDIRTYAVMPLNEECGLLEWVANTHALKNILEKGYSRQGKRIWVSPLLLVIRARVQDRADDLAGGSSKGFGDGKKGRCRRADQAL